MEQGRTAPRLEWRYDTPPRAKPGAQVSLHFEFAREGNKWVGTCLELSTSTYARTRRKVEEALYELVLEHLNLLEESGERNRFFDEWGIRLIIPPAVPAVEPWPQASGTPRTVLGFETEKVGAGS